MNLFIKTGGMGVIAAVFAILVFIAWQVWPLFAGASVEPLKGMSVAVSQPMALVVDEWGERPAVVGSDGSITVVAMDGTQPSVLPMVKAPITAVDYDQRNQRLAVATNDGKASLVGLDYTAEGSGAARRVSLKIGEITDLPVGGNGTRIVDIAYADSGNAKLAAVLQEDAKGVREVHVVMLGQASSLMGKGKIKVIGEAHLAAKITGKPSQIMVDDKAESVLVANEAGVIHYFHLNGDEFELRQVFSPFERTADTRISNMGWIFGDVSVVFSDMNGKSVTWSLFVPKDSDKRLFGMTKQWPVLPAACNMFAGSVVNKSFIQGAGKTISLRYNTTESVRWEEQLNYQPVFAVMDGKYRRIITLGDDNLVHVYNLDDHHPESGLSALFGKVWYEGQNAPAYTWQSSSGNDDFEAKISLIPLIFGTFKATLYAMLFSVPIALAGAMYTAEFMHPRFKTWVKPTVEVMASLPSVVLGFLAALWLAPLIETDVPSIICVLLAVPTSACLFGLIWSRMSPFVRSQIRPGYEFLVLIPLLLIVGVLAWVCGPMLERACFTVIDSKGVEIADFRRWWPATMGVAYEQRNSLIVGFMMGFAIIPIIFTIAEDSFTNVPKAMRSASLALGASRWQTAMRVVLPTASAGIFSAVMIGLGRGIGETMIVVMATGNTAIMDFNIFNGMRTLSANIAVELPEAPQHSTLYRTLFLGGFLLFMFTFVINTVAELARQHLREKYKTV